MDFNATIIGQTIAMAFFVWFCMKYIWPPLTAALDERAAKIAEGLAAGEKAIAAQAEAEKEAEKLIYAEARNQAQDIIENANKRAGGIVDEAQNRCDQGTRATACCRQVRDRAGNQPRQRRAARSGFGDCLVQRRKDFTARDRCQRAQRFVVQAGGGNLDMADLSTTARPYAKAIFELAQSSGKLTEWSAIAGNAGQPSRSTHACSAFISDPKITPDQVAEVVLQVAGDQLDRPRQKLCPAAGRESPNSALAGYCRTV